MKKLLFVMLAVAASVLAGTTEAEAQKAFPGAKGYAENVTGGRGGKVYYVTSLKDCEDNNLVPGTLRWALRSGDDTPRTILFAVNGTIYLEQKLKTNHPNVSILGQSAPGGGICITGYPVVINNRNYIIRYVRFRAGEVPALEGSGNESYSALDIENAAGVILDHCSVTWSMEECLTMFDNDTTTVQNCIIGEGLYHSYNVKTTGETSGRAFAMQWGGDHSNMHHVLITNCNGRAPRFNGNREANAWLEGSGKQYAHDVHVDGDFANNVLYNWGGSHLSYYGGEFYADNYKDAPADLNAYNRVYMRNNYFRPGPSTKKNGGSNRYFMNPSGDKDSEVGEWYLSGNKFELDSYFAPTGTYWSKANLELVNANNMYGFATGETYAARGLNLSASYKNHLLASIPQGTQLMYEPTSADEAYLQVTDKTKGAGANLPRYDEEDQRLVDEAGGRRNTATPFVGSRATNASQRPGIIDAPEDVKFENGYDTFTTKKGNTYTYCPSLALKAGEKYAVDSDGDGMPDAYEDQMGLNKTDKADGNAIASNGYTNLENYLNGLADFSLNNADYQTSDVYVEPGLAVRPQTVTITFAAGDADGVAPAPVTIPYGGTFKVDASNTSLYKEGYTMTGWTDGSMTYELGQSYTGNIIEDVVLMPSFVKNSSTLDERNDDVSILWDFTLANAPKLEGKGFFVAQTSVNASIMDVVLHYEDAVITIPAANGSVAEITYKNGTQQKIAAVGNPLTVTVSNPSMVKTVAITLPYVFDPASIEFHSPVKAGTNNYELTYFTNETDLSVTEAPLANPWMKWIAKQQRLTNRNCIDPEADNGTYYVAETEDGYDPNVKGKIIIGPVISQQNKVVMYVKDVAKIRTFVSGSCYDNGKSKDRVVLTAYPADGSEKIEAFNNHPLDKATLWSESFDIELDPEVSYMIVYSTMNGFDMMLGAVKLYDKTAASASSGEGTVQWMWESDHDVEAVVDPAKIAFSTQASYKGVSSKGVSSGTAWLRFPAVDAKSENYVVSYTYTPAAGVTFAPSTISFENSCAAACKFDVVMTVGNGTPIMIKEGEEVTNTTATSPTKFTYPISIPATKEPVTISIYPYSIQANKAFRLRHITLAGTYDTKVVKHQLTTTASPANGGAIVQTPKGSSVATGQILDFEATAAQGFVFDKWTDGDGSVLSKNSKMTYTMPDNDVTITANFIDLSQYDIFTDGPYQAVVSNAEELILALAAAKQSMADRYRIFLKNATYDLGKTAMTAVPANTSLIGESQNGVLIMNNPDVIPGGNNYQDLTPTLFIDENQNNIYMQDLTVRQARDWETKTSQGQALAIRQRGKQAVYKNVSIEGVQDTYYLNKADGTAYFEDCTVAGEVDFIYGDGTMYFQNCNLLPLSSGAKITAANTKENYMGIVFNDCVIDRHPEAKDAVTGYALGRCWDDSPCVTYLNTTMKVLPLAAGWQGMTPGLVIRFHEYGSKDANGNELDLSDRSISACKPDGDSDEPVLEFPETFQYALGSVFPDWNPKTVTSQLTLTEAPVKSGTSLSWDAVKDAYCYAVVKNGQVVGFTTENTFAIDDANAIYNVRVANKMGGLGLKSADAVAGSNVLPGDANGDGQVSVADLSLMASYILGSDVTLNIQNADVNGDGQLSVADLSKVASIILQIEARRSRF